MWYTYSLNYSTHPFSKKKKFFQHFDSSGHPKSALTKWSCPAFVRGQDALCICERVRGYQKGLTGIHIHAVQLTRFSSPLSTCTTYARNKAETEAQPTRTAGKVEKGIFEKYKKGVRGRGLQNRIEGRGRSHDERRKHVQLSELPPLLPRFSHIQYERLYGDSPQKSYGE